ncbi:MAG: hypothetical protein EZS28_051697, partial [Streblomastix strix]
MNKDM